MRRVLITGGAGFIGSNLVAYLSECGGYEITVLDNESTGDRGVLSNFPVEFVEGDIRDRDTLRAALEGQHAVVHLAADTRVINSIADPQFNFDVNVCGSFRLLEACREEGINHLVAASTGGAILGDAVPPVTEDMPPRPTSPYGASKLAMEGYLSCFASAFGMSTCSLRFSNVYGPRCFHKGSVVASFFRGLLAGDALTIYGDGSQTRDFLYVDDLSEGIRRVLETNATGVFQLGSGVPTTINELLDAMRATIGTVAMELNYEGFRAGEVRVTWCKVSKAERELGFAPKTPLSEGLASTWRWFLDQTCPSSGT